MPRCCNRLLTAGTRAATARPVPRVRSEDVTEAPAGLAQVILCDGLAIHVEQRCIERFRDGEKPTYQGHKNEVPQAAMMPVAGCAKHRACPALPLLASESIAPLGCRAAPARSTVA